MSIATEGSTQTSATGTCTDTAGNISAAVSYSPLNIDLTPPSVTANRSPAANPAGWNNTPVVASFTGLDSLSGVAADGCSVPISLNLSGSGQSASGGCTDLAGNTSTASVTGVNIDLDAPVASATVTPAANAANWHKSAVTVSFDGTDSLSGSGLVGCTAAATVTTDGTAQVRAGTCSDLAGNTSNTVSATVNLDATSPSINITAPTSGGSYVQNSINNASYTCTDTLSGIIGCLGTVPNGNSFPTSNVGTNTFTVQATDLAGNTASRSVSYTVTAPSPFSLSPGALAFGDRLVNSSTALAVSIRNNSTTALTLTTPTLSGTNANQFTLARTCGTSLAAGAICTVTATFRPTSAGSKTAAFSIRVGASTKTVPLSGNGVAVAFTVSPTSLTFPTQARNTTSASQTVTVTSGVSLPITISSINLGGKNANQFVKSQTCGSSLAPNANCTVSISFKPTSAGTKTATLTVTPSGGTAKTVAISGVGL